MSEQAKVVAFERKATDGIYTDLAKAVYPSLPVLSISNFRGVSEIWTGTYLYDKNPATLSDDYVRQETDIIQRCRFLRSLDFETARGLASRFWNEMTKLFDTEHIVAVFQPMVDEYTLDIMERVARAHGVPVVSFVGHFFNGYFCITTRGELNILRDHPTQDEIRAICASVLSTDYKPSFERMKQKSQAQVAKVFCRRKLIETCYYPLMKKVERDPLNYHYNTIVLGGAGFSYVSNRRYEGFSSIEDIAGLDLARTVYLPLHMIPEATTDYWCDDWHQVRYEEGIVNTIESSDDDIIFAVKEHPSMDGWRNPAFYKRLLAYPNVYLIPPHENSNALLNLVDNVVVHTGSVGIEALMRGKRAFCLTSNYYSDLHPAVVRCQAVHLNQMMEPIPEYDPDVFVGDLLRGLYPGTWVPTKNCRKSSFDALVAASKAYLGRPNE